MNKNIFLNSREELISMFLGLGVVILVVVMIFNFIIRRKGNVSLTGLTTNVLTTPGPLSSTENNTYEVKKGDTLWSIALTKYKNGHMWTRVATENKLKNASVIEVGQKLILPDLTEVEIKTELSKADKSLVVIESYKVVRNDSLWKIAVKQFGNGYKWTQIWNLNRSKINDPNRLEIGMVIKLR